MFKKFNSLDHSTLLLYLPFGTAYCPCEEDPTKADLDSLNLAMALSAANYAVSPHMKFDEPPVN